MKAFRSTCVRTTLLLTLISIHNSVHADQLKTVSLTEPYSLTLSCLTNMSGWSPNHPCIALNVGNSTSRTLFFSYAPGVDANFVAFSVEYKASSGNPNQSNSWVRLSPNIDPVAKSKHSLPNFIVEDITNKESIVISSDQEKHLVFPPDFPMSKMGFYRITAVLTVPEASEYNGAVSPSTKVRSFDLVIRSQPLIVKHTVGGFAPVDAIMGKGTAPQ